MFFISKHVASGIKALREREHVMRELEAIRAMPGVEVYVNAIAEGVREGHRPAKHVAPAARPAKGKAK